MSFSETIFLFLLALVVFGPKKLPEIARQIGKVLNEFRRASNEFKSQIEQEISHLEVEERKQSTLQPSAAPEGTASRSLNSAPAALPATLAVSADNPESIPETANPAIVATEAIAAAPLPSGEAATPAPASAPEPSRESQESHA